MSINLYVGSTNAIAVNVKNLGLTDSAPTITSVTANILNGGVAVTSSSIGLTVDPSVSTRYTGEWASTLGLSVGTDYVVAVTVVANSKTTVFHSDPVTARRYGG